MKKCKCGKTSNCPKCSNIKMAIMLKNNQDHLKTSGGGGKLYNPVWYNFLKHNNNNVRVIIDAMKRRFENQPEYKNAVNKLIFYNNATKQQIHIETL